MDEKYAALIYQELGRLFFDHVVLTPPKYLLDGTIDQYKARLVRHDFSQQYGID